jgi:hypothetical protein
MPIISMINTAAIPASEHFCFDISVVKYFIFKSRKIFGKLIKSPRRYEISKETQNSEPGTWNPIPGTGNPELFILPVLRALPEMSVF